MATDERVVVEFDQHTPEYRETYPAKAHELREQCPVAWSTAHDGFWIVTGHDALSALSKRADLLSNDHDPDGERKGYQGISVPARGTSRGGFIEMRRANGDWQRKYNCGISLSHSPTPGIGTALFSGWIV